MKIALLTTRPSNGENRRIGEEVKALGHDFNMYDLSNFEYSIRDGKLIVEGLENFKPEIIIMREIFKSIKPIATFLKDQQKQGVKIFDNNFLTHLYSINKVTDLMKLAQKGIPVPDAYHLHSFEKFIKAADEIGYPIVCKLTRTGKGAGIYKFDNSTDFQVFINDLEERDGKPSSYMVQKFVNYKYDLRVLIIGDKVFCMRRIPGEGEFRANFSLGGSVELFDLDDDGKKLAKDALDAINLSVGGVDVLITEDNKRYILEVNHTMGFLGMEEATGENIAKMLVEHAIANAK